MFYIGVIRFSKSLAVTGNFKPQRYINIWKIWTKISNRFDFTGNLKEKYLAYISLYIMDAIHLRFTQKCISSCFLTYDVLDIYISRY